MTKLFPDTDPQIERVWLEMLRQAPVWRKLHMMAEMNRAVRELALLGLRKRYPNEPPERLRRRLAARGGPAPRRNPPWPGPSCT
jgi:hypothetical protein